MSVFLDIFFPKVCLNCGKFGRYFCKKCRKKIAFADRLICPMCLKTSLDGRTHQRCLSPFSMDGLIFSTYYRGIMKKALKTLKYRLVSDIAEELTGIFLERYPRQFMNFNLIMPVPLHKTRLRERGFNQSEVLAKALAKRLKIRMVSGNLFRTKATVPQFNLEKKDRKLNVKNVFVVRNPRIFQAKKVAIIDDVATTVSTLRECAKVLKKSGASSVWGLVIAHG